MGNSHETAGEYTVQQFAQFPFAVGSFDPAIDSHQ